MIKDYGELRLAPQPVSRNVKGQFTKGHKPYNKGKKWEDYMSKRQLERARRSACKNIARARLMRVNYPGRPTKKIIAVDERGQWTCFESIKDASLKLDIDKSNISRCAGLNLKAEREGLINTDHHCYGIRFYYESSLLWFQKTLPSHLS